MKTRNAANLFFFLFLLILVLLFIYDFWRLADIDSLKNYYWTPMASIFDYETLLI